MSYAGKWGYTRDEEFYFGCFDTAEEAAQEGASEDGETVIVGQFRAPVPPEDCFDADDLFERVWCHEDYSGDWAEGTLDCTNEQQDELVAALSKAFGEWLDRHRLRPTFGVVDPGSVRRITVGSNR